MSPSRASSLPLVLLLAAPAATDAGVSLDVRGELKEAGERLTVRVDLINRGDRGARAVEVEGRLLDARSEARLAEALPAGATRSVILEFPREVPRPGVHALALHLRYVPEGSASDAEATSQRAYLLMAIGANPPPSVRLTVPPSRLVHHALVNVHLESTDEAPHRVTLRVLTPRGLNALEPEEPVAVPASGTVTARVRLLRAGAPRGARPGIVVLAHEVDGPLGRTAVATAEVEIAPDNPWLPRLRVPLLVAALVALLAAILIELKRLRPRHPA